MPPSSIVDRIRSLLETTDPFSLLTVEARDSLLADLSVEYFTPDEVILEQGTSRIKGLYIVESGLVRLRDVVDQRLISKVGEGQVFGVFGLLKNGVAIYEATALESTVCVVLGARRFLDLYKQNEDVAAFFDQDVNQYVLRLGTQVDVPGAHLLFGRRLNRFAMRKPARCTPEETAQTIAQRMHEAGDGLALVMEHERLVGLVTDADLRRLVAKGLPPETPARALMTTSIATIDDQATLFDAIMAMLTERTDALVVNPETAGTDTLHILTDRDVAHFRGMDPLATVGRIDRVATVEDLANVRGEISLLLARLYRQEVPPEPLGRFLSALYDRISIRVLHLAETTLRADPPVPPVEIPWVWLRLGSSGRQEMALTSKQHNALIYATPENDAQAEQAERWFGLLAERVNLALEACGFAPSEVVAQDPQWRQSLRGWKRQCRTWIFESDAATLQQVLVFFDLRGIYGTRGLVDALRDDLTEALNVQMLDENRQLLALLSDPSLERPTPLAILRHLVPERFRDGHAPVDLREQGILPVVDAARILALEARYLASTNTYDRLRHAAEAFPDIAKPVEAALEAYRNLVTFRLERQLKAAEEGEAPSNQLIPELLTKYQRNFLRNALDQVATLQDLLAKRYRVKR